MSVRLEIRSPPAASATPSASLVIPGAPILWAALFLAVLDLSYYLVRGGSVYYALPQPAPDPVKIVESFLLLTVVIAVAPKDWKRVSTLFIWMLLVLSYIPMLTIYAIVSEDRLFIYATSVFWIIVALGARPAVKFRLPAMAPARARFLVRGLYGGFCVIAVFVLVVYLGNGLIRNILTTRGDLSNFYSIRSDFVSAGLPLHGYYFYWLAQIFNPLMFVVAIRNRRWVLAGLVFVWQLVIAEAVGQRGFVFDVAFAAALSWLLTRREPARALSAAMIALVAGGVAFFYLFQQPLWYYFFTGRFLLDAAQLSFDYYHFFSDHGVIPLAYLVKFYLYLPYPWPYPYAEDPSYAVSVAILHQHLAAVGGLVADAYMNFGLAGLALWALGLIVLTRLIDALTVNLDRAIAVAALAVPVIALANTYTVRVLFTTGLGWSLVMLFLLVRGGRSVEEAESEAVAEPVPSAV